MWVKAEEAHDMPLCLPWSGRMHKFDEMESSAHLSPMPVINGWAPHMKIKLLTFCDVTFLLQGFEVEIAKMASLTTLPKGYDCCDTGQYSESHTFTWIWGVGTALVMGECHGLRTMVNTGGDHWVAIALDFEHSVICYGDSFGQRPVKEVTWVFNWWTFHHAGNKFIDCILKITTQKNWYLCSLLGTNVYATSTGQTHIHWLIQQKLTWSGSNHAEGYSVTSRSSYSE